MILIAERAVRRAHEKYIKLHILGDITGPKTSKINAENFQWQVQQVRGSGQPVMGWQKFSSEPVLVYTSSPEDQLGSRNRISFQYKLDLPNQARGGRYSLSVAYLLTEEK